MDPVVEKVDLNRIAEYNATRTDKDFDLVYSVRYYLALNIPEHILIEVYDKDPDVMEAKNKKTDPQQYILNKYFTKILMEYRGIGGYEITGMLHWFSIQVPVLDWLSNFVKIVVGFLTLGKVFQTLYKVRKGEIVNEQR